MPATAAKPGTSIAEAIPAVDKPTHKLSELTTYELRDYRRELENAITFFDKQCPVPPARIGLQSGLDAVIAEQDDRTRLAARA
jgi:hypothetical protein